MNETAENFAEMVDLLITTPAQIPSMHMIVPLRSKWETGSLLIHMGRDHGLAPYSKWAKFCFNTTIKTFGDLSKMHIDTSSMEMLRKLYR